VEALDRSGQGAAATGVVQLFLEQNPNNVAVQLLAAGRHMARSQWRPAIRIYEGLRARLGDRDAILLNNLAWAWSQEGENERAVRLAYKAWSLDRANPATTDTLGWILYKSGHDKAAGLALLQRASAG
jgi:cellulose synthase operon protein C